MLGHLGPLRIRPQLLDRLPGEGSLVDVGVVVRLGVEQERHRLPLASIALAADAHPDAESLAADLPLHAALVEVGDRQLDDVVGARDAHGLGHGSAASSPDLGAIPGIGPAELSAKLTSDLQGHLEGFASLHVGRGGGVAEESGCVAEGAVHRRFARDGQIVDDAELRLVGGSLSAMKREVDGRDVVRCFGLGELPGVAHQADGAAPDREAAPAGGLALLSLADTSQACFCADCSAGLDTADQPVVARLQRLDKELDPAVGAGPRTGARAFLGHVLRRELGVRGGALVGELGFAAGLQCATLARDQRAGSTELAPSAVVASHQATGQRRLAPALGQDFAVRPEDPLLTGRAHSERRTPADLAGHDLFPLGLGAAVGVGPRLRAAQRVGAASAKGVERCLRAPLGLVRMNVAVGVLETLLVAERRLQLALEPVEVGLAGVRALDEAARLGVDPRGLVLAGPAERTPIPHEAVGTRGRAVHEGLEPGCGARALNGRSGNSVAPTISLVAARSWSRCRTRRLRRHLLLGHPAPRGEEDVPRVRGTAQVAKSGGGSPEPLVREPACEVRL